MKYLFLLFAIFFSVPVFAQQITYEQWQAEAKTEINLQPEYGNAPKNEGQKQADRDFIKIALKSDTTPLKASEHLVSLGFTYLYRGDLETAMRRFNQAWLLDPKNENAYWGYGAIYASFNDYKMALDMYEKGLAINPKSSNILTDKATMYMVSFEKNQNVDDLKTATEIFKQSYIIDRTNQNTLFKLSICYFFSNDCTNAMKYYNECKKLGGKPITSDYTNALMAKCNK